MARLELGALGIAAGLLVGEDPAVVSTSICRSRFCPRVETRAFPMKISERRAGTAASGSSGSSSGAGRLVSGVVVAHPEAQKTGVGTC
ncbi:hypothetical protein ACIBI3_19925 [Actinomadura luteofluorescens]|uniref:hypothetical protein n=1 Tax=Actinomadura luteofluorescens TaxID=46163 RepID=UPI0034998249